MSTLTELQDILVQDYRVPREQAEPGTVLTTIGLDSLSVLELMFKIEDHFRVKIAEDTPSDLKTVGDVVGYIDGLLAKGAAAGAKPRAEMGA